MAQRKFRDAKDREIESYITYLVEQKHKTRKEAEEIAREAHIGILDPFTSNTPDYIGITLIVFEQGMSDYKAFMYYDKGKLEEIEGEKQ